MSPFRTQPRQAGTLIPAEQQVPLTLREPRRPRARTTSSGLSRRGKTLTAPQISTGRFGGFHAFFNARYLLAHAVHDAHEAGQQLGLLAGRQLLLCLLLAALLRPGGGHGPSPPAPGGRHPSRAACGSAGSPRRPPRSQRTDGRTNGRADTQTDRGGGDAGAEEAALGLRERGGAAQARAPFGGALPPAGVNKGLGRAWGRGTART